MKKFIIIMLIIFVSISNNPFLIFADQKFARATSPVNLFGLSTDSNNLGDIICIVEKSYFVEILADNGDNYKVNYNGVIGFVKKNDVSITQTTPQTPFPKNIEINIATNCNLRRTPTTKSPTNNIITTIYKNESDIKFIGRIFADEAIDFGGTTWYYVCYKGEYGYIYNQYIKSITPIYENTEIIEFISSTTSTKNPIVHTPSLIIVILLLLPCLAILLILYLPRKTSLKQKKTKIIKEIDKY